MYRTRNARDVEEQVVKTWYTSEATEVVGLNNEAVFRSHQRQRVFTGMNCAMGANTPGHLNNYSLVRCRTGEKVHLRRHLGGRSGGSDKRQAVRILEREPRRVTAVVYCPDEGSAGLRDLIVRGNMLNCENRQSQQCDFSTSATRVEQSKNKPAKSTIKQAVSECCCTTA